MHERIPSAPKNKCSFLQWRRCGLRQPRTTSQNWLGRIEILRLSPRGWKIPADKTGVTRRPRASLSAASPRAFAATDWLLSTKNGEASSTQSKVDTTQSSAINASSPPLGVARHRPPQALGVHGVYRAFLAVTALSKKRVRADSAKAAETAQYYRATRTGNVFNTGLNPRAHIGDSFHSSSTSSGVFLGL